MSQSLGKGTNVGNSQMEWLYDSNSGKPTNDDYLMGKAVDKNFERMGTEGQINAVEYDCCPESIFSSQVEHQVDLQRKLQEDPLVSLKMKEVDTRKKILDNPLKMREINSYVSNNQLISFYNLNLLLFLGITKIRMKYFNILDRIIEKKEA